MDEGRAGQARRWLGSACRAFQASCRPLCRRLWPSGLRPGCRAGLTRPALKGARGVASRRPATPAQLDTPPPRPSSSQHRKPREGGVCDGEGAWGGGGEAAQLSPRATTLPASTRGSGAVLVQARPQQHLACPPRLGSRPGTHQPCGLHPVCARAPALSFLVHLNGLPST